MAEKNDSVVAQREAFRRWLEANDLKPFSAATKAGVSPGAIYNYLAGKSDSLSAKVLKRLAAVTGDPVDSLLTGSVKPIQAVPVTHTIGSRGSMFDHEGDERVERPAGVANGVKLSAAIIDGNSLHPFPDGWAVFFETHPCAPEELLDCIAVVRFHGSARPVVRRIRHGSEPGLFDLHELTGAITPDVEIKEAHRVVSFSLTKPYND